MIETKLRWHGIERSSYEECRVTEERDAVLINSEIAIATEVFSYCITTDAFWNVESFAIRYSSEPVWEKRYVRRDGIWLCDGEPVRELDGCNDIDILFTPFTNSLPIKRLQLKTRGKAEIKVVYIDPDSRTIYAASQRYTRLSGSQYRFETVPEDFEAVITVDQNGFVIDYPGLFTRA